MSVQERALSGFRAVFHEAPQVLVTAPGRVNIIGEHTDYNGGFVLPIAIDRRLCVAVRSRQDTTVRVYSTEFEEESEFVLDSIERSEWQAWSNYIRGVAWVLQENGLSVRGMDACIASDIPLSGGLSSSAALETASALAFLTASGFIEREGGEEASVDHVQIAHWCQRAENEFVGVNCGIMDQMVCLLARRQQALFIDCRDLSYRQVPIASEEFQFLVCDTAKKRALASSEYNLRRQQCEEGVRLLSQLVSKSWQTLRDVEWEALRSYEERLPQVIARRCRHVLSENQRVKECVDALEQGNFKRVGWLMNQSHESLRTDYEVSCFELDVMVELLRGFPGVLAARLTGAGFGGCAIALAKREAIPDVLANLKALYQARTGLSPRLYPCIPSEGARICVP